MSTATGDSIAPEADHAAALLASLPYDTARTIYVPQLLIILPLGDCKIILTQLCDELQRLCEPPKGGRSGASEDRMQNAFVAFFQEITPRAATGGRTDPYAGDSSARSVSYELDLVGRVQARPVTMTHELARNEAEYGNAAPIKRLREVDAAKKAEKRARASGASMNSTTSKKEGASKPDMCIVVERDPHMATGIVLIRLLIELKLLGMMSPTGLLQVNPAARASYESAASKRWQEAEHEKIAEVVAQTAFGLNTSHLLSKTRLAMACFNVSFTRLYHRGTYIAIEVGHAVHWSTSLRTGLLDMTQNYALPVLLADTDAFGSLACSFFIPSDPARPDDLARARFLYTILFSLYHCLHSPETYPSPVEEQDHASKVAVSVEDQCMAETYQAKQSHEQRAYQKFGRARAAFSKFTELAATDEGGSNEAPISGDDEEDVSLERVRSAHPVFDDQHAMLMNDTRAEFDVESDALSEFDPDRYTSNQWWKDHEIADALVPRIRLVTATEMDDLIRSTEFAPGKSSSERGDRTPPGTADLNEAVRDTPVDPELVTPIAEPPLDVTDPATSIRRTLFGGQLDEQEEGRH